VWKGAKWPTRNHRPTLSYQEKVREDTRGHERDDRQPAISMTPPLDRRDFLARLVALPIATGLSLKTRRKAPRPPMTVYMSPECGCCGAWTNYVRAAGFKVTVKEVDDADAIRKDLGIPAALASCHTAVVGSYLIEGHVPADLIDRILAEKPTARGLAVPGMPGTAPGMDVPGSKEKYDVLLFTSAGKATVFAKR
jgi:hypothetical protein